MNQRYTILFLFIISFALNGCDDLKVFKSHRVREKALIEKFDSLKIEYDKINQELKAVEDELKYRRRYDTIEPIDSIQFRR
jgi:hypothetical protein